MYKICQRWTGFKKYFALHPGLMTYIFMLFCLCASIVAIPSESLKQKNNHLNSISTSDLQQCLQFGIESINQKTRLEDNLLNAYITVKNGSLSHTVLLDALPNAEARADSEIAKAILASSLCIYNTKCLPHDINGIDCEAFLINKPLPLHNELTTQCNQIVNSRRNGHSYFRRLLPRRYKDGFYEMFSDNVMPSPLLVSRKMHEQRSDVKNQQSQIGENNLAIAQWTQFIEHDLSKSIVTSMGNGNAIECCNRDNYELQPRYRHPACAPLVESSQKSRYGRINCLNYVRSAVAVGSECTFGAVEQLNQATGGLDLSQLYGFTDVAKRQMRAYENGEIKSTPSANLHTSQLPIITVNPHEYCAFESDSNFSLCFMAGDSRVNNNPLSISIYTIFMRNHNQIARKLARRNPHWNDDRLYEAAKSINIHIYRRIVFQEWLPVVLGESIANKINQGLNSELKGSRRKEETESTLNISNEFAVAAIRFYLSMMPNRLVTFSRSIKVEKSIAGVGNNLIVLPDETIFAFNDQIYKPYMMYTPEKLDMILESSLFQPAMKMDSIYEENLVLSDLDSSRPTHSDLFAFDIQRGRDHGLQGYVNYLEFCTNTKVSDWKDLELYITKDNISKLRNIYNNIKDIDLIVGSLSEMSTNDAIVGPTLSCILSEQFSQIFQFQQSHSSATDDPTDFLIYKSVSAVDLLCANSNLQNVPRNIFQLISNKNPPISCDEHLQPLRY